GGAIAVVFGFLWAREATSELRGAPVVVPAERRDAHAGAGQVGPPANVGEAAMPHPEPGERFPRSKFLEGATLGLGGVIGGLKTVVAKTVNGKVTLNPALPAGFGCPCHGGQYDTEGNRTAGPPVRALDRYSFEIRNGHLVLLSTFSVSRVDGTGAQAKIHAYKEVAPGDHYYGVEHILYQLNPPHQ